LFLADATLYMEFFGIVAVAWQWLLQAVAVNKAIRSKPGEDDLNSTKGNYMCSAISFGYELPKMEGLYRLLLNANGLTVEMHADLFSD